MAPAIIIFSDASALRTKPIDKRAGVAQLVELQPSKLDVASSNLVSRSNRYPVGPVITFFTNCRLISASVSMMACRTVALIRMVAKNIRLEAASGR